MFLSDEEILELLNLPEYLSFIDTDKLDKKNYMRLFVETAKNHIADYNNVNLTKKIENVQVKIIDNRNEINGYSFYYNGHNIICINSGALIKLMEVMLAFVENSNFMPSIGTVSKNHLEEKPKSKVINNRIEWSTYIQDSTRQDLAFALYYFACLTLIYHEIGHLIHGHTQISKNHIFNYLSICEMACRIRHGLTEQQLLDKRTIEMDADAYAMSHILYTVEVYYNDRNLIQGKFITSKEMMCEILLNSIIIVHLILQDVENISIEDTLYSTHLPASYRLILAADSLRTAIKNTPSTMGTYDSISEQFYKSIGTCMNIYNEIWDKSKTAEDLANDLLSFDKYYDPIKNNWDALRDILIRYSYIELPPKYSSNK